MPNRNNYIFFQKLFVTISFEILSCIYLGLKHTLKLLRKLDANESSGLGGIPAIVSENCAHNSGLHNRGVFPNGGKTARI